MGVDTDTDSESGVGTEASLDGIYPPELKKANASLGGNGKPNFPSSNKMDSRPRGRDYGQEVRDMLQAKLEEERCAEKLRQAQREEEEEKLSDEYRITGKTTAVSVTHGTGEGPSIDEILAEYREKNAYTQFLNPSDSEECFGENWTPTVDHLPDIEDFEDNSGDRLFNPAKYCFGINSESTELKQCPSDSVVQAQETLKRSDSNKEGSKGKSDKKEDSLEEKRKVAMLQAHEKLRPPQSQRFRPAAVQPVVEAIMRELLVGRTYKSEDMDTLPSILASKVTEAVEKLNYPRSKIVTNVIIGQELGQAVQTETSYAWDPSTDNFVWCNFVNGSLFCNVCVYGVHFY